MPDYLCEICHETWDDFYDCKSHVYTNHQEDTCGIASHSPEMYVREYVDPEEALELLPDEEELEGEFDSE